MKPISITRNAKSISIVTQELKDQYDSRKPELTYMLPAGLVRLILNNLKEHYQIFECVFLYGNPSRKIDEPLLAQSVLSGRIWDKLLFRKPSVAYIALPESFFDASQVHLTKEEYEAVLETLSEDEYDEFDEHTLSVEGEVYILVCKNVDEYAAAVERLKVKDHKDFLDACMMLPNAFISIRDFVELTISFSDEYINNIALNGAARYFADSLIIPQEMNDIESSTELHLPQDLYEDAEKPAEDTFAAAGTVAPQNEGESSFSQNDVWAMEQLQGDVVEDIEYAEPEEFMVYDAQGQPVQFLDENENVLPILDEDGQLIQYYDEEGQPLPYYDERGQQIVVNPPQSDAADEILDEAPSANEIAQDADAQIEEEPQLLTGEPQEEPLPEAEPQPVQTAPTYSAVQRPNRQLVVTEAEVAPEPVGVPDPFSPYDENGNIDADVEEAIQNLFRRELFNVRPTQQTPKPVANPIDTQMENWVNSALDDDEDDAALFPDDAPLRRNTQRPKPE